MTPPARDERRWTIRVHSNGVVGPAVGDPASALSGAEDVAVVPAAAHEAALAAARQVDEAAVVRMRAALAGYEIQYGILRIEQQHALPTGAVARIDAVVTAAAALLAALTPEQEGEAMSEIPRPPFRTPCQYCGTLIPANGVCPRCAPPDEHAHLEADLAALREAAQRLRDEREAIRRLLPSVYDGMHLADCPYVDVLLRIRAVLASADSESREETP